MNVKPKKFQPQAWVVPADGDLSRVPVWLPEVQYRTGRGIRTPSPYIKLPHVNTQQDLFPGLYFVWEKPGVIKPYYDYEFAALFDIEPGN